MGQTGATCICMPFFCMQLVLFFKCPFRGVIHIFMGRNLGNHWFEGDFASGATHHRGRDKKAKRTTWLVNVPNWPILAKAGSLRVWEMWSSIVQRWVEMTKTFFWP